MGCGAPFAGQSSLKRLQTSLEDSKLELHGIRRQLMDTEQEAREACDDEHRSASEFHSRLVSEFEVAYAARDQEMALELALFRAEAQEELRAVRQERDSAYQKAAVAEAAVHGARQELSSAAAQARSAAAAAREVERAAAAAAEKRLLDAETAAAKEVASLHRTVDACRAEFQASVRRADQLQAALPPLRSERDAASDELRRCRAELAEERGEHGACKRALLASRERLDKVSGDLTLSLRRHLEVQSQAQAAASRLQGEVADARRQRDLAQATVRNEGLEAMEAKRTAASLRKALDDKRWQLRLEEDQARKLQETVARLAHGGATRSVAAYLDALGADRIA